MTLDGVSLKDLSIQRLKMYEPPEGYYLAFSGGKDSQCLYHLAQEAGVRFDAHYSCGGIDPPEVVRFIRENYPDVIFDHPNPSFWNQVQTLGMPTRLNRWCCRIIKEGGGENRFVLTGVRFEESTRRKHQKMVDYCPIKNRRLLRPIIDWQQTEVWEYLGDRPHCVLYDEGWKRIGCVLCPMNRNRIKEAERWPKIARAWQHAAERYWQKDIPSVKRFPTPESFYGWWLSNKSVKEYLFGQTTNQPRN